MAVIEKNLGPVSAYAVAVANGYEGTEEQWAAEIAAASQNAQAAAGSAAEAAGSAAAAAQSVTDANNAKTAAQQAAETASAAYGTDLLAATFAADAPYVSGEYVIYNGGLYVFTADHPAGAWIGTDASQVQVGGKLTDLKSAISILNKVVEIESGAFNEVNGTEKTNLNKRLRNASPVGVKHLSKIVIPVGYSAWWYALDSSMTLISPTASLVNEIDVTSLPVGTVYVNFSIRKQSAPNDDISADAFAVQSGIVVEYIDEIALNISNDHTSAINALDDIISNETKYSINNVPKAIFDDGISGSEFCGIEALINESQSGSGSPTLTNIRPIVGTTELAINHGGLDESNIQTYSFDLTNPVYRGSLRYISNGVWKTNHTCVLANVTYEFFSNATSISFATVNNIPCVIIRNAFYYTGNGITYPNKSRRSGGYYCKSNVFDVIALNDTRYSSSQQRLYLRNDQGWADTESFLASLSAFYGNGGTIQFLYEPTADTDELSESFTKTAVNVLSGVNTVWASKGFVSVSYIINLPAKINDIENRVDILDEDTVPTSIVASNDDAVNKILSSRWLRSSTASPLTLLWFTDIHRWSTPLQRILDFKAYLMENSLIDGTIVTGDLVRNAASEGSAFSTFWNIPGTEDIMIALGNHDYYASSSQPHGKETFANLNTLFFGNADNWGVERESNYPFYYKDYDAQSIRLIVADPAVTSDEANEESWLTDTLNDAKIKGYSVVVAAHYLRLSSATEITSATILDNAWSNNLARVTGTAEMTYDWAGCDIVKCVTNFIADGGSFLCYIIGHTHTDILSYPTGHPEQLIINLACASDDRTHETKLTTNDLPRFSNTRTQDCFNVITFDATNKIIKCVRIGANVNMYQIPRTAFGYDVANHTFLSLI